MGSFAKRVSQKISKLTSVQLEQLIDSITQENETITGVMESLNTGLVICDEEWHLVQKNKAAERYIPFVQYSSDIRFTDAADVPVWEIIHDEDIAAFLSNTAEQKKNTASGEFTVAAPADALRVITVSTQPLVKRKKFAGTIIKIDDITEKRNQETLLRRMENLASLTNLAASVAHEIKNPLGSISIHIQLMQKALKKARLENDRLPDKKFVEKHLDIVNEEIDRLNQIIMDFLFAVRPVNATLEPVDTTEFTASFVPFFEPDLKTRNITLKLDMMQNPPHIMIDEKLFKQVLINLVQNAIAAMPSGGMLYIASMLKNDRLVLTVADNGIGMDEQTVQHVFEPYFTTKTTGTGLGLTMVYKIIKEFSGDINIKSHPGEGTVFIMTFPVPQKELRLLEYAGTAGKNGE